jgi:tetraacyldisaccharide 4'-kinase
MREPEFWSRPSSLLSTLLAPLASLYGGIAARRLNQTGHAAEIPVICVGNYQLGGAGKTPAVLAISELLRSLGENPIVLSRGYRGRLPGPVRVDPQLHRAADVGDEPLMMAAKVPVVVARDRVAGAALACSERASVIVMDDGFQNPSLTKTASLIVIDAARGIGNGHVFPAGPLRAPLHDQLPRTDAIILVGDGVLPSELEQGLRARGAPLLRGHLVPDEAAVQALRGKPLLAFAGIGHPPKFFRTLQEAGLDVAATRAFADHHPYTAQDLTRLRAEAAAQGFQLVTTRKDASRLDDAVGIAVLDVALRFDDPHTLRDFLTQRLVGRA